MNVAIAQHLNIAEESILRVEEWANCLFVVAKKLGARFVSKKVGRMDTYTLKISDMPARAKKGWVRKGDTFLNADEVSSYGTSHRKLTFHLKDGMYEVQDANFGSSKTNRYWIEVANGQCTEVESPKIKIDDRYPKLEGSEKQIDWAQSIRQKAVDSLPKSIQSIAVEIQNNLVEMYSAKWFIDNRNGDTIASRLKQEIKKIYKEGYPKKEWIQYEGEYAHEGLGGQYEWIFDGQELELGYHECRRYYRVFKNTDGDFEIWSSIN